MKEFHRVALHISKKIPMQFPFSTNIKSTTQRIVLEIKDDGDAYNPLQNDMPDTTLEIEDRPIGGLGIFLVKNYMDTFDYAYSEGHNCINLSKQL